MPAAIHLSPEALDRGAIAKLRDGDVIELDADAGVLRVLDDAVLARPAVVASSEATTGMGRELFAGFRSLVGNAEDGASIF